MKESTNYYLVSAVFLIFTLILAKGAYWTFTSGVTEYSAILAIVQCVVGAYMIRFSIVNFNKGRKA